MAQKLFKKFLVVIVGSLALTTIAVVHVFLQDEILPPPAFTKVALLPETDVPDVYLYGNPAVSLEDVYVRVVYFVPESENTGAQKDFVETEGYLRAELLPELIAFHEREFLGRSRILFSFYPEPFFGNQERSVYEREFLHIESSDPLRPLENEVRIRATHPDGDLFQEMFAKEDPGAYDILLFIYAETIPSLSIGGVDAFIPGFTGDTGGSALVFAPVVDPSFRSAFLNAGSIVYHELLHAMGVPEQYDLRSPNVFEQQKERNDILGIGTLLPLSRTRVGEDVKKGMGL